MAEADNGKRAKGRRFVSLYLENWRNFLKVDLELQRRMFLVGPNASGKSNLLDVFRFFRKGLITEVGCPCLAACRGKK